MQSIWRTVFLRRASVQGGWDFGNNNNTEVLFYPSIFNSFKAQFSLSSVKEIFFFYLSIFPAAVFVWCDKYFPVKIIPLFIIDILRYIHIISHNKAKLAISPPEQPVKTQWSTRKSANIWFLLKIYFFFSLVSCQADVNNLCLINNLILNNVAHYGLSFPLIVIILTSLLPFDFQIPCESLGWN